jgi:hypothetical protein
MAIYNFELKAKAYFDEKLKVNPSVKLLKKLEVDYKHLQSENDSNSPISTGRIQS